MYSWEVQMFLGPWPDRAALWDAHGNHTVSPDRLSALNTSAGFVGFFTSSGLMELSHSSGGLREREVALQPWEVLVLLRVAGGQGLRMALPLLWLCLQALAKVYSPWSVND